ncbi:MAG: DUF58 domain-containing protein, partial [Pseudonocardiaceae bacterium]
TLSLGYLLTFFLAALGVVAMLHTFRNVHGLRVRWRAPEPVFAGDNAVFPLLIENPSRHGRYALDVATSPDNRQTLNVSQEPGVTRIALRAEQRGMLRPGKITVETRYPLGLFRAWARLSPDVYCLVYPRPARADLPLPPPAGDAGAGKTIVAGNEELQFLRVYRQGDSPRRLAWHAYARGRGLLTKQFAADEGGEVWLDFAQVPGAGTEAKLSRLTRWVLDADAAGIPFGLRLPGGEVPPATGEAQRRLCLERLALHDQDAGI